MSSLVQRRLEAVGFLAMVAVSSLLCGAAALECGGPGWDPCLVTLKQGQVKGMKEKALDSKEFFAFRGLPFAKPPVGELRFMPPQPSEAWTGVRNGMKPPPSCAQGHRLALLTGAKARLEGKEDCLYLNVFSPRPEVGPSEPALPVMVFIHGGAFIIGNAAEYAPHTFMSENIVLVVIQYRLGTLGFISTEDSVAPGNMGIQDQAMALKWIHENIAQFGGDPHKTTIFGESAGAVSVHLHVLSDVSSAYFQRAIIQSGTATSPWAIASKHREGAYAVGRAAGCHKFADTENTECTQDKAKPGAYEACLVDSLSSEKLLHCLRQAPISILAQSSFLFKKFGIFPMEMAPRLEQGLLKEEPALLLKEGRHKKMDIMLGVTSNEGGLSTLPLFGNETLLASLRNNFEETALDGLNFCERDVDPPSLAIQLFKYYVGSTKVEKENADKLTDMFGDMHFWYPTDTAATTHAASGGDHRTFLYEFAYRGQRSITDFYNVPLAKHWVTHGDDLMYLFAGGVMGPMTDEEDKKVSKMMVKMWASFAATGNPTPEGSPVVWLPFSPASPNLLIIDANPRMDTSDRKSKIRDFWRSLPLNVNKIIFSTASTITADRNEL